MDLRRLPFLFTNHVANPVLGRLLRTAAGRRLGRRLALVRYTGRRTGATRQLVTQYRRDGYRVLIVPQMAGQKHWWRNFLEPRPVELWLAGARVEGVGRFADGVVTVEPRS